jgi:hypothetical protein
MPALGGEETMSSLLLEWDEVRSHLVPLVLLQPPVLVRGV